MKLGLPVRSPEPGPEKFMPPLVLNTNLIKRESKTGYPQTSIWDRFDLEPAVITNTLCSTTNGESHKVIHTHP